MLGEPGPTADQLDAILTTAARVPDHKKLVPWRFIVFEGDARLAFGNVLADALAAESNDAPSEIRLETERMRFMRAPVVVGVVSSLVRERGVPELEQTLSAGAACFNLCLAANALGYQTSWITEWYSYSPGIAGMLELGPDERMAGFIYIGSADETQADRDRPDLGTIVHRWSA